MTDGRTLKLNIECAARENGDGTYTVFLLIRNLTTREDALEVAAWLHSVTSGGGPAVETGEVLQ